MASSTLRVRHLTPNFTHCEAAMLIDRSGFYLVFFTLTSHIQCLTWFLISFKAIFFLFILGNISSFGSQKLIVSLFKISSSWSRFRIQIFSIDEYKVWLTIFNLDYLPQLEHIQWMKYHTIRKVNSTYFCSLL